MIEAKFKHTLFYKDRDRDKDREIEIEINHRLVVNNLNHNREYLNLL